MACCDLSLLIQLVHPESLFSQERVQANACLWSLIQPACIITGKKLLTKRQCLVVLKVVYTAILELYATAQGFAESLLAKC